MSLIQLNDTQQEIQAMARAYAQRELVPLAGERDQASRFDRVMVTQMAELGFFGMLTPERFDGLDLDAQSYLLALEEIAVGDASAAVLLSVHNSLPTQMILDFGTEAQQQRFLPPMARGEWLGAFALSEPEAGSDAAALRCQAVRDGDDWLLSGTKAWVSHGNEAGVILCMARTDSPDDRRGSKGISTFILTPDLPGFHLAKKENKMGLRASPTLQINLDNCRVPGDRLLGEAGQGFVYAMGSLDHGRLGIAAQAIGIARAAADVSDGLLADAGHVASASRLAVHIERGEVPLSGAARRALALAPALWANVLGGGDDYELVIAVPPRKRAALLAAAHLAGVQVTPIGRFERGGGARLTVDGKTMKVPRAGYVHF